MHSAELICSRLGDEAHDVALGILLRYLIMHMVRKAAW